MRRLEGLGTPLAARPILTAGVTLPPGENPTADGDNHTETAWRLRHIKRSVLKQDGDVVSIADAASEQPVPAGEPVDLRPRVRQRRDDGRVVLHRDAVLGRGQFPDDVGARPGAAPLQRLRPARRGLHVDRRARGVGPLGRPRVDEPVRRLRVGDRRLLHVPDRDEPRLRLRRVLQHAAVPERERAPDRAGGRRRRHAQRRRDLRQRSLDGVADVRRSTTAPATRTTTTCGAARC